MKTKLFVASAAGISMLAAAFSCRASDCAGLLPAPTREVSASQHLVTGDDLVRLRDVGPLGAIYPDARLFSLSPDKTRIAFQIRRADPVANTYCNGVVVLDLAAGTPAALINTGGDLVRATTGGEGFAALPSGMVQSLLPKWSPDGQWVAFLRRDDGVTQLWRAKADGSASSALTHADYDVDEFDWSDDGQAITFSGRPGLNDRQSDIAREGLNGYLFDDRFVPSRSPKPWARGPVDKIEFVLTIASGNMQRLDRSVRGNEAALSVAPLSEILAKVEGTGGAAATIETKEAGRPRARTFLVAHPRSGKTRTCALEACSHVQVAWWSENGETLYYLALENQRPRLGLYRWAVGRRAPSPILETEDALGSCEVVREKLLCVQESSKQPRRFVNIDLITGQLTPVFDPNPEFADVTLGEVTRLRWTNAFGVETYGDLVLPPGYRAGSRVPLVVVGYESRGFLRGGTGDEYPIQLLAANGFAVLSYQRPVNIGWVRGGKTYDEIGEIDRRDWADRRSVQSSIDSGVDLVVSMGIADPDRVGLTGFSDGAAAAQFALVNSHRYSAMAVSQCCENALGVNALVGPAIGGWLNTLGYPRLTEDGGDFWKDFAVRMNLGKIGMPILMELSDDEYLGAMEDFTALREQGKPVEMFVFSDEHHVKWQPAHRLAIYRRTVDWFGFWLQGREDPDPAKAEQYRRWRDLRGRSSTSSSPGE